MYSIGDKVVHPGYGPGVITAIERKQVIGEAKRYYVIAMMASSGTLMTPVKQADKVGLRPAISDSSVDGLLRSLSKAPNSLPTDFRERQDQIEERLKDRNIYETAALIRDLAWYDQVHGLTKRDGQYRQQAEELLAAELALVEGIEVKAALEQVQTTVAEGVQSRLAQVPA